MARQSEVSVSRESDQAGTLSLSDDSAPFGSVEWSVSPEAIGVVF